MRARIIVALGLMGLLASGCAGRQSASATGGGNPLSPKVITVTAPDSTVLLHMGDTLVFRPSLELMMPGLKWNLVSIPQELELTSKPGAYPFVFTARKPGVGTLQASVGPPCGSLGPATEGVPCPVAGAGSGSSAGMPIRQITITVKVYAQGAG